MNSQRIYLDVSKVASTTPYIYVGQGDVGGTTIEAHVFDNGEAFDMSGMSARFVMRMPGHAKYVRDYNCTVSGNVITYVVDEEHVAAMHGKSDDAYFTIVDGETQYSTSRFTVHVLRSALDGSEPAESWDNAIDELLDRGNNQLDEYAAAESARATAEGARVSAESLRAAAETARENAESARSTAESARDAAEDAREDAEAARVSAEAARVSAESSRVTAESGRVTAENGRAASIVQMRSDVDEAIADANAAAEDAREAATTGFPTMSTTTRGGAKLGDGLSVTNEVLSVDVLTDAEVTSAVTAAFEE